MAFFLAGIDNRTGILIFIGEEIHSLTYTNPIYSVLYLDGDEQRLAAFESAFSQDYHVYTAALGRTGLEIMVHRTIQLVIADQSLPDMTGIGFLERIMPLYPDCTRMVQTGTGDMESVARAADRGIVFQYVTFPWKREELKITIDAALEVYYLKVQNRNLDNHLNEVKQTLERKVMERTRKIEQQRINMTDSIRYASRIQKAMMLSSEELERIMPSHFILNKPKDIVSGDFFWVSNRNGRLIVALADCTGHGVPGAFMSILGINLLNEIVSGMETPRTADILNELRSRVVRAMGQTGKIDEAKEGMEMALCMLDPGRGMIQFSGANRPLYLASGGELKVIKGDRMPIGVYYEEELPFTSTDVPCKKHDILYLFTDGFVDQIGGLHRKTFRTTRFRKLIQEICHRPLDEQKAILREEHEIWRAGQEQIDDIMVMGIRL